MKSYLLTLVDLAARGKRKVKGHFVSHRRLLTYKRVADITPEIPPGDGSLERLEKLLDSWRDMGMSESTIKTYVDVLKMVPGKYDFPKLDVPKTEPQHLPIEVAWQILIAPLPFWVSTDKQRSLWTATKLSLNSALRPGDSLSITKQNIAGDILMVKHQKTGVIVRSQLHPAVAEYLAGEIERNGDVYPFGFSRTALDYRKRMFTDFVKEILVHYDCADNVVFDTADGTVKQYKLKDVITAHSLRASSVALMLSKGIQAHDVKAVGGWSQNSPIFAQHYLKPNINIWGNGQG